MSSRPMVRSQEIGARQIERADIGAGDCSKCKRFRSDSAGDSVGDSAGCQRFGRISPCAAGTICLGSNFCDCFCSRTNQGHTSDAFYLIRTCKCCLPGCRQFSVRQSEALTRKSPSLIRLQDRELLEVFFRKLKVALRIV